MIKLSQFDVQIIMRVTMKSSLSPEREFLRDVSPTSRAGHCERPLRRNQPPPTQSAESPAVSQDDMMPFFPRREEKEPRPKQQSGAVAAAAWAKSSYRT